MIRKLLASIALVVGAVALFGPATPASAGGVDPADYTECIITVSPGPPYVPGQTVTVNGEDFQPNFTTTISVDGEPVKDVDTGPLGNWSTSLTLPQEPGNYVLSAPCNETGDEVATTNLTISGGASPGALPTTGSDPEPLLIFAALAILAGLVFVVIAKRRRRSALAA